MELAYYWKLFRRWWWMLLLGTALAGGGGYLVSGLIPPTYRAATLLIVNQTESQGPATYQDLLTSQSLAKTYSRLIHSDTILADAIKQLDFPVGAEELRLRTTAQVVGDSQLLQISAEYGDPTRAARIADALAQSFIARMQALQQAGAQANTQWLDAEINDVRQRMGETGARLSTLRALPAPDAAAQSDIARLQYDLAQHESRYFRLLEMRQAAGSAQTQAASAILVVEPAYAGSATLQSHTARNVILAGFLGLMLTAGLALLLEYLDDRVRSPEEIRQRFGLPLLATVGSIKSGGMRLRPERMMATSNLFSESVRVLQANLDAVTPAHAAVLCITSALPGEGKSTIVANLALAEAQAGKKVVLIDANLRDPGLQQFFGVSSQQGLSAYLAQPPRGTPPALQTGPAGIMFLPSGPQVANPSELLGSPRMAELIAQLRPEADLILLDSAPLLPVADTVILQRVADGVVIVADARHTRARALGNALQRLRHDPEKVLGIVLNKERQRKVRYGRAYAVPPLQRAEAAQSGSAR